MSASTEVVEVDGTVLRYPYDTAALRRSKRYSRVGPAYLEHCRCCDHDIELRRASARVLQLPSVPAGIWTASDKRAPGPRPASFAGPMGSDTEGAAAHGCA